MTTFRLATTDDDALLRSMLRRNSMPSWVDMCIEREPSFFAGRDFVGEEWAVIAENSSEAEGMYTAAVLPVHADGRPEMLRYLGGLRVNARYRHRLRLIKQGYASVEPLAPAEGTLPWWFTVIAAGNVAARRLLEAGLPGLPEYRPLGDYVTYALSTSRGRRHRIWHRCSEAEIERLIAFHNEQASAFQLAPVLDARTVRRIGLEHFLLYAPDGRIAAVAALWDQRAFKQVVAHRYRRPIGALVPAYNSYAKLFRRIRLPREGQPLQQTFIAYLAIAERARAEGGKLLQDLLARCQTPVACLGVHSGHWLTTILERFKPVQYPARIYAVSFSEPPRLSPRPVQPEVALL